MTFSFAHPVFLWLLVIPAALLVRVWWVKAKSTAVPVDFATGVTPTRWRWPLQLSESLPPLLLAVALLFLAGPQHYGKPKDKRQLTNIQFCLDVSGSMMARFGDGSRYDACMAAVNSFLTFENRKDDAFGLTIFGNQVLHWVPITNDVSAFKCAPPFLRPEKLPWWFGGTSIGLALKECMKVLTEAEKGDRLIILLSDGYSGDLGGGRDVQLARQLKDNGITVYAIHVASGAPPPPLVTITSMTGGDVFAAGEPEGLEAVFKHIDTMEKAPMEKSGADLMDDFRWLSITGLLLLALFSLAQLGLRYTPW
ncbi:MAG: vWA domain-containing protein [Planctomycetota bacterium]|jgi:Ca-activated chloride channel family protein